MNIAFTRIRKVKHSWKVYQLTGYNNTYKHFIGTIKGRPKMDGGFRWDVVLGVGPLRLPYETVRTTLDSLPEAKRYIKTLIRLQGAGFMP